MKTTGFAKCFLASILSACFVATDVTAYAGGSGTSSLDWPHAGEVLDYRSCGCADACWMAEVRHQRTKALKARLRCDCETLHYSRFANPSVETDFGSCEAINRSERKPEAIREKLEELLRPPAVPRVQKPSSHEAGPATCRRPEITGR